eukprot:4456335-Pyramimonas_sp.AAC.1
MSVQCGTMLDQCVMADAVPQTHCCALISIAAHWCLRLVVAAHCRSLFSPHANIHVDRRKACPLLNDQRGCPLPAASNCSGQAAVDMLRAPVISNEQQLAPVCKV